LRERFKNGKGNEKNKKLSLELFCGKMFVIIYARLTLVSCRKPLDFETKMTV